MYVSMSKVRVPIAQIEVDVDEDDDDVNIHFVNDQMYISIPPDEFAHLVATVAKALGWDVSEHPFSGATIVTMPNRKESHAQD